MSDQGQDPSGNTEAFRAFVQRTEGAAATPDKPSPLPMIIIGGVVIVVIAVVVILLVAVA